VADDSVFEDQLILPKRRCWAKAGVLVIALGNVRDSRAVDVPRHLPGVTGSKRDDPLRARERLGRRSRLDVTWVESPDSLRATSSQVAGERVVVEEVADRVRPRVDGVAARGEAGVSHHFRQCCTV
jgi:hypothetical protein